jgi:hypothetical protein
MYQATRASSWGVLMLVIAAVPDPDWSTREGPGDSLSVHRIFAGKSTDRGKQGRQSPGKSPSPVGTHAEASEQRPAANEAARHEMLHDLLNGHKRLLLP